MISRDKHRTTIIFHHGHVANARTKFNQFNLITPVAPRVEIESNEHRLHIHRNNYCTPWSVNRTLKSTALPVKIFIFTPVKFPADDYSSCIGAWTWRVGGCRLSRMKKWFHRWNGDVPGVVASENHYASFRVPRNNACARIYTGNVYGIAAIINPLWQYPRI